MLHDSSHCIDTNPVLFFTCFGDSTKPVDFPVPKFSLCFDINDVPNTPGGYVKVFTHITELSRENKNLDNHLLTNKVYPKYGIEVEQSRVRLTSCQRSYIKKWNETLNYNFLYQKHLTFYIVSSLLWWEVSCFM